MSPTGCMYNKVVKESSTLLLQQINKQMKWYSQPTTLSLLDSSRKNILKGLKKSS